jgi:outer membrane protein assembly factor BamB
MYRSLTLTLLLLLTACLLGSTMATAEENLATIPAIVINPTVGPPTTKVSVSGIGFDPYAAVDIYFDLTDMALTVTNGAGAFGGGSILGGIAIQVPASAVPGTHWITAVERYGIKAAQKPFIVRTDWAQFHFSPDHKGVNPFENLLSPATVVSLGEKWNDLAGEQSDSPAVVNGVVYLGASDGLYAFNASTGALLWRYATNGLVLTSAAVANGLVYFGSYDYNFYALNAATGALQWKYATRGPVTSPTVANDIVYVGSWDGNMYAFNARSGALLWVYTYGGAGCSTPAVADGAVYFGSTGGVFYLFALNATTGSLLWRYDTGNSAASAPAVANGVVYIGSFQPGGLYAFNASTGALLWRYAPNEVVFTSPAVANGLVYFGSEDDNVYALNASTGALVWKFRTGNYVDSSPAVANGLVYIGSDDNNVYALNASTGALLWQYTIGGPIGFSSPVVANGMVYVGSDDGNLYAFGLASEQLSSDFNPPERPDPKLLVPDYSLQPRAPVTTLSNSQQHTN